MTITKSRLLKRIIKQLIKSNMKRTVERNQSLKTQPGFIPNRDGPELKAISTGQVNFK